MRKCNLVGEAEGSVQEYIENHEKSEHSKFSLDERAGGGVCYTRSTVDTAVTRCKYLRPVYSTRGVSGRDRSLNVETLKASPHGTVVWTFHIEISLALHS